MKDKGNDETPSARDRLRKRFGSHDARIIQKFDAGWGGADLVPGSALRWPKCDCGDPERCPDYVPPAGSQQ